MESLKSAVVTSGWIVAGAIMVLHGEGVADLVGFGLLVSGFVGGLIALKRT